MGTSVQPTTGAPAPAAPPREDILLEDVGKKLAAQQQEEEQKAEDEKTRRRLAIEIEARKQVEGGGAKDPRADALAEALRISEEGRRAAEERLRLAGALPAAQTKDEPKALTTEELQELYSRDPIKAIGYMNEQALKAINENIERRLGPLVSGSSASARESARAKYPDEFELFGSEIDKLLQSDLVSKASLSNPQAWDDLIAYVRGRPGNFEKLFEHRSNKNRDREAEEARKRQAEVAGAHVRSETRAPAPSSGNGSLDDTEREIARALFRDLDPEDAYKQYTQWRGVSR